MRAEERQEGEKGFFSRIFGSELTNFPEKQEVLGRSKSLERSSSGRVALSKKRERDPRNGLAGRIKVKAFKSFRKSCKSEESFSSEVRVLGTRKLETVKF
jgi:hypothetical protein